MYTRTGINDMLADLAADMPQLLKNEMTFVARFAGRSADILAAAAPGDHDYVRGVLQEFLGRCEIYAAARQNEAA